MFNRSKLALAVALFCGTSLSAAAQAPQEKEQQEGKPLNLEVITVTGSVHAIKRAKIESTNAITTKGEEDIALKNPTGVTDLLQVVPGFWAESSGGESSNNVFVRGLPQDGGYKFLSLQEDGLPVIHHTALSFLNPDTLWRQDLTVSGFEAVRGGTGSVFASSAPGGIVNFTTKQGDETPEGQIKMTVGDYGLVRVDAQHSGALDDKWYYSLGGFYRTSEGVRDPGFTADRGGQFRLNLLRELENGELRFNYKTINDRNTFLLPVPLQNPDDPKSISGFDANYDTLASNDFRRVNIKTPDGDLQRDLADGIHTQLDQFGGGLSLFLNDDWHLEENFRYVTGKVRVNGIFPGSPSTSEAYLADQLASAQAAGWDAAEASLVYNGTGEAFDGANDLVLQSGWWTVDKPMDNFINDIRLSYEMEAHTLTMGLYFSDFQIDDSWSFNNILSDVAGDARLLDVNIYNDAGELQGTTTDNGFTSYGSYWRNASSESRTWALYFADDWQVSDKLRVDIGLRYETMDVSGSVEVLERSDLGGTSLADDNVAWGSGRWLSYEDDFSEFAWSIGANYRLNDEQALFGRISDGFRLPNFDHYIGALTDGNQPGEALVGEVTQIELGYSAAFENVGLFLSGFYSKFDNVEFSDQVFDEDGNVTTLQRFAQTLTIGLEAEVVWQVSEDFELSTALTLQQPEYKDYTFTNADGESFDFDGNQVRRIPKAIFSIAPSYHIGDARLYANLFYGSKRFTDETNSASLPSYYQLDAGVMYNLSDDLTLQFHGANLTNEVGLTEGNPRTGQLTGDPSADIFMARPILGRHFKLSLAYKF